MGEAMGEETRETSEPNYYVSRNCHHHSHCMLPEDFAPIVKEPGCHPRESLKPGAVPLNPRWRRSTVKVSSCVHCAAQEAQARAKVYRAKGKCLSPLELLVCSVKLLESYLKKKEPGQTPDVYANVWLPLYNVVHPYDIQFAKQVLYGCVRYEKLLDILISRLHDKCSNFTYDDDTLYKVLAYLALLRLHELSWAQYRRLLWSQPPGRMLLFLESVFDNNFLVYSVQQEWRRYYDSEFIRDMISSIEFFSPEARALCHELHKRVDPPDHLGRYVPPPTVPKPFKMSVSKIVCPQYEEFTPPAPYKARPAPMFKKGRTLEMKRISKVLKDNRQILKQKYSDPKYQPFKLRTVERPTNIEQLRIEVEEKYNRDHCYIPAEINAPPDMPTVEVKLNVSTLLREHSRFQKQLEEDRKKIGSFETQLRDDSDFKLWLEEQRMQTEVAEAIQIEFNRKMVMATDQAAIAAKEKYLADKIDVGRKAREETKVANVHIEQLKKNEKFGKKIKHFLVIQKKRGIKTAREKVLKTKKTHALEVMATSEELCAKSTLAKAQEMAMKQELVRQLRALEKESCHIEKKFDIYSTGGQNLLQEMSIAQLRTELVLVKRWLQHEEDVKRKNIHATKIERQNMLLEKSRIVTQMRHVARAQWLSQKAAEKCYDREAVNPAEQLGL